MNSRQYERIWARDNRIFSVLAMTHPTAVLLFGGSVFILTLVAQRSAFEIGVAIQLMLAMIFAQITIGVANEVSDVDIDTVTKKWRAIPAGHISRRGETIVAFISFVLAVGISASVSITASVLLSVGIGLGILYSARLKRTRYSWIPYAIAYPAVPIWVWLSLDQFSGGLYVLFILAFPLVLAICVLNELRDFDEDFIFGLRGFVHGLGKEPARRLAFVLLLACPLPFLISGLIRAHPAYLGLLAIAALIHWLLILPVALALSQENHPEVFRTTLRKLQVSGPIMFLAWLLSI